MQTLQSHLCGQWQSGSGPTRILDNPTTEAPLAQLHEGGLDFAKAVAFARDTGGPALRALGFGKRAALLKSLSTAIYEKREELVALSATNGGSTRGDAKFDIDGATGTLAAYAAFGAALGEGQTLPDGDAVQLSRSPRFVGQHVLVPRRGVAVHINAFNFPCWGLAEKLACSLLAGVPTISKPGTASALVAFRMAQIIADGGILPAGAFQFVVGSASPLLDQLGPQDAIAFTGSAATGTSIKAHAAVTRRNCRLNVEADSINAAVLAPETSPGSETWNLFLKNVVTDMTQKAGQKCTAVRRIYVPTDRVADVTGELVARLEAIAVGDPALEATQMGPLASKAQLADVRAGIQTLMQVADVLCGGASPAAPKGWFVKPTLLRARDPRAAALNGVEVFGPVATVVPYDGTAAQAVELCNLGGGGLVASVYGEDKAFLDTVLTGLAPWHGRVWAASEKVAAQSLQPGMVLPATIHGGPGRAGGGEELGGLRGLSFYLQRVAFQGDVSVLKGFGPAPSASASGATPAR